MPLDNLNPSQSSLSFPSIQEKNLEHLIKVLGTKESIDALSEIGDIEKDTWKDIAVSIVSLKDFVTGGGISVLKTEISGIVQEQIYGAFSPLMNELQPIIDEVYRAIEPIIPYLVEFVKWGVDVLVPVVKWIADTIQDIIDFFKGPDNTEFWEAFFAKPKTADPFPYDPNIPSRLDEFR
jgi:hypothetical protein